MTCFTSNIVMDLVECWMKYQVSMQHKLTLKRSEIIVVEILRLSLWQHSEDNAYMQFKAFFSKEVGKTENQHTYILEINVLFLFLGTRRPNNGYPKCLVSWHVPCFFSSFIMKYDHTFSWRLPFSGMWCLVVWKTGTNVSDNHATNNFRKSRKYKQHITLKLQHLSTKLCQHIKLI
jgi:hypothetical protein